MPVVASSKDKPQVIRMKKYTNQVLPRKNVHRSGGSEKSAGGDGSDHSASKYSNDSFVNKGGS